MNFMTTEGDRSGVDTLTKSQKAQNILDVVTLNLGIWKVIYPKLTKEENLAIIQKAKEELETMERLLNA